MRTMLGWVCWYAAVYAALLAVGWLSDRPNGVGILAVVALLAALGVVVRQLAGARRYGARATSHADEEAMVAYRDKHQ